MTRLTVGLASAVTFGALSALAGARAVDVDSYLGFGALALALFGLTLLLPVRERPSRDKSPHPSSFRRT